MFKDSYQRWIIALLFILGYFVVLIIVIVHGDKEISLALTSGLAVLLGTVLTQLITAKNAEAQAKASNNATANANGQPPPAP